MKTNLEASNLSANTLNSKAGLAHMQWIVRLLKWKTAGWLWRITLFYGSIYIS